MTECAGVVKRGTTSHTIVDYFTVIGCLTVFYYDLCNWISLFSRTAVFNLCFQNSGSQMQFPIFLTRLVLRHKTLKIIIKVKLCLYFKLFLIIDHHGLLVNGTSEYIVDLILQVFQVTCVFLRLSWICNLILKSIWVVDPVQTYIYIFCFFILLHFLISNGCVMNQKVPH